MVLLCMEPAISAMSMPALILSAKPECTSHVRLTKIRLDLIRRGLTGSDLVDVAISPCCRTVPGHWREPTTPTHPEWSPRRPRSPGSRWRVRHDVLGERSLHLLRVPPRRLACFARVRRILGRQPSTIWSAAALNAGTDDCNACA